MERNRLKDIILDTRYVLECLVSLDKIQSLGNCNNCNLSNRCKYAPELGDPVRYNCPFYESKRYEDDI